MKEYDLESEDTRVKYNTKACEYYRLKLKALAKEEPFEE